MTYNFGGQEERQACTARTPTLVGELERHFIMEEMMKRETLDKYVFLLLYIWVRHEEPGN